MSLVRLSLFALITAALAGLGLAVQARPGAAVHTPARISGAPHTLAIPQSLETLEETRNRPLFIASRRPLVTARESDSGESGSILGRYEVVGALAIGSKVRIALRAQDDGSIIRVSNGDTLDGWWVRDAGLDGFRLEREGTSLSFQVTPETP